MFIFHLFNGRQKVTKMPAKVNNEECTGCGICVDECPATAIELKNDKAKIDKEECTDCGTCVDSCPNNAISIE
jgi:NAD-dependent dihydropyrimidine dehydrogenase PreA subunit